MQPGFGREMQRRTAARLNERGGVCGAGEGKMSVAKRRHQGGVSVFGGIFCVTAQQRQKMHLQQIGGGLFNRVKTPQQDQGLNWPQPRAPARAAG